MPSPSIRLKIEQATKVGKYSTGVISYEILSDESRENIWIRLTSNDSTGWFSRELIHTDQIFDCIKNLKQTDVILSKSFTLAFKSKSANNAGFLAAALRSEGLLKPATDQISRHVLGYDFSTWAQELSTLVGAPITESAPNDNNLTPLKKEKPTKKSQ